MVRLAVPLVILAFALSRGTQRVLTALALEHASPWTITAVSLTLACAVWLPIAWWRGWLVWDGSLWVRCIPLGLVNIGVPAVAFIAAQQFVTAATAALLVAFLPVVVAVSASMFLKERLRWPAVVGIGVATSGVIVLTLGKGGAIAGTNWWVGIALVGLGVAAAASVYVGWRGLLAQHSAVTILAPQLVVSALATLPICLFVEGWSLPTAGDWAVLSGLAVVNYVIPQLAMFWLLARTTALRSALANYLAPLFATLLAVPILGQLVTPTLVLGGVLILAGAVLVNTARQRAQDKAA